MKSLLTILITAITLLSITKSPAQDNGNMDVSKHIHPYPAGILPPKRTFKLAPTIGVTERPIVNSIRDAENKDTNAFWANMKNMMGEARNGEIQNQCLIGLGWANGTPLYDQLKQQLMDSKLDEARQVVNRANELGKDVGTRPNLYESLAWFRIGSKQCETVAVPDGEANLFNKSKELLDDLAQTTKQYLMKQLATNNMSQAEISQEIEKRVNAIESNANQLGKKYKQSLKPPPTAMTNQPPQLIGQG